MNKTRVLLVCIFVMGLTLGLVWGVAAQGPLDSSTHVQRKVSQDNPALSAGDISAAALGQPGTVFRYAQTFGVLETPYFSDTTHIYHPNGLFMDGSDNLYVTEEQGARLLRYNSSKVNTLVIGKAGVSYVDTGNNYVLSRPYDATLDNSGNIWVADGSRVIEYDAAGVFVQQYPATNPWENGSDNGHFQDAQGVAFDSAGRMFIADTGNHRIQIYTFDGGGHPVYDATIGTGSPGNGSGEFNMPYRLVIDQSSDRLYVVDYRNNRVQQCTFGGGVWTCTTLDGGLNWPRGIALDSSNNVYIADTDNGRIRTCLAGGGACSDFVTGTYWPYDVAVDSAGNVYAAATYDSFIVKYDKTSPHPSSAYVGVENVPYLTDNTHYNRPHLTLDNSNNIIVVEENGQRLLKLNSSGTPLWAVGTAGVNNNNDDAYFDWPYAVATDSSGRIYVANNRRVKIHNGTTGAFIVAIGTNNCGTGNYDFCWITGVAVDKNNGYIYVTDADNHRVQIYDSSRIYVDTLGSKTGVAGSDNTHFNSPRGVEVDAAGNIYVADINNCRVQKFNSSFAYQMTFGITGSCGSSLLETGGGPEDVAIDAQGRVYITSSWENRVQVFSSNGDYLTTIGGNWGDRTGRFRNPSSVALDSSGNVYVADGTNHRIQKFALGVPNWSQVNINGFGDRNNTAIHRMAVFSNALYASTRNETSGGEVWRSANGATWNQVNADGFGVASNISALVGEGFNGFLYVGTDNGTQGGEIWRCAKCDNSDWQQVVSGGFGDSNNATIERIIVFSNTLYATTSNYTSGVEVWKSSTGEAGAWTQANTDGFSDAQNTGLWALTVFNGYLYAATAQWGAPFDGGTQTGVEVWRTNNGVTWNQVNTDGFGDKNNVSPELMPFNGYLYALTYNANTRANLWRCDVCNAQGDWEQVLSSSLGDGNNDSGMMFTFDNNLYIGTSNSTTGIELWRSANGSSGWSQVNIDGFGDSNNETMWDNGIAFNKRLYLGTANNWANGAEIWAVSPPVYLPVVLKNR